MEYTGTVSILPKRAKSRAHSRCLSGPICLKLRYQLAAVRPSIRIVFLVRQPAPRTTNKWGFCTAHMWVGGEGEDHSVMCLVYALGWPDAEV
jgi:hypothetical protein